jgi:putative ABC transport system permease protein
MTQPVQDIALPGLIWGFVPALVVVGILFRWSLNYRTPLYALARMLVQLLLAGYALTFVFAARHAGLILLVLGVMLCAAGLIALHPVRKKRPHLYLKAFAAIGAAGIPVLALVCFLVLELEPWYLPHYVVPLAGITFAGSMTAVSLAAERFEAERGRGGSYDGARAAAFHAALIPLVNSLLAVGLVALPGTMTGQILSGVSPLIAVKYQIVVLCMIFGASGIAAALYLQFAEGPGSRAD